MLAERVQRLRENEIAEVARGQFQIENIICLLAAHHAELQCFGNSASPALRHALDLNDGDAQGAELLIKWLDHRAQRLVKKHWPQVHKLAFKLLEHEKLSGQQIRETLAA